MIAQDNWSQCPVADAIARTRSSVGLDWPRSCNDKSRYPWKTSSHSRLFSLQATRTIRITKPLKISCFLFCRTPFNVLRNELFPNFESSNCGSILINVSMVRWNFLVCFGPGNWMMLFFFTVCIGTQVINFMRYKTMWWILMSNCTDELNITQ